MSKIIQGFKVLPIPFSTESTSQHDLFMKEHSVRNYDEQKPPGRTLFLINVPPYANEDNLKSVFGVGKVTSVIIQKSVSETVDDLSKNGFKIGYVVFANREGLLNALKLDKLNPLTSTKNTSTGLRKWIQQYNSSIYNHDQLSGEVNQAIKNNDVKEKADEQPSVDDEGWTVVTKKGRNPGLARKESVENKIHKKNKLKSRKKELKNFYTFQLKEQKMKNVIALRKSFQDSKEKVNLMKKMRNFKPY